MGGKLTKWLDEKFARTKSSEATEEEEEKATHSDQLVMYLYLKFGNVVKIVSNVTVDDDCGPVVDGQLILDSPRHGDSTVSSKSTIDAISWFKSLPMEAVYIDCGARDARWCTKSATIRDSETGTNSPPPSPVQLRRPRLPPQPPVFNEAEEKPFMPESARPLYSDHPGVLDFNPIIDEMFEGAEDLFCNWDELERRGELNKEIAKILHCYVFPAVMFNKEDIPSLQECMRIVIHRQEDIEKEIMAKERVVEVTEKYLTKQKEVLLMSEELTTQSYLQASSKEFVEKFYIHVTRDIQSKNMKLDIIQVKINDLKRSRQDPEKLERLKRERDSSHEVIQKLLVVREAIRNHLYRPFIPQQKKRKRVKLNSRSATLQSGFQQVHKQLCEDKDDLKRLCYRKLHTSSMREALESSIQLLRQESPSNLGDFSEFSVYCGSREENRRQWKSMQGMVDGWMSTDSELHRLHMEGCQLIKDLAEGMLSDLQIASMGMDASAIELKDMQENLSGTQVELSGSSSASGVGSPDDKVEDNFTKRAPMVQVLRDQVIVHTWEMAERVVNNMNFDTSPGSRHINRAWVCYCPHFWKVAGKAVESIYTHYHAPQARKIHRLASSSALADIMDSNFFREFFLGRKSSDLGSYEDLGKDVTAAGGVNWIPPMDAVSAASLDLQRCSLTDLYAFVNRDGARLNCQMIDMKSIKCSVSSIGSCDSNDGSKKDSSKGSSSAGVSVNMDQHTARFQHSRPSSSDSGASVHSDDLFDNDDHVPEQLNSSTTTETARSSQTLASVLGLFDSIVEPYHEKVKDVLKAEGVMEKMRLVWQSVDFLSRKTGDVCKARGMDTLLPMSIFTTASFSEDLFVKYYVQLLILTDLKPSFAMHSMYDFSLTNALATYMYLFEAKFSGMEH